MWKTEANRGNKGVKSKVQKKELLVKYIIERTVQKIEFKYLTKKHE